MATTRALIISLKSSSFSRSVAVMTGSRNSSMSSSSSASASLFDNFEIK